jgi:large subunit ribosomal protein LP1
LSKVIKASGNEVEPYWPALFAKALKGQKVEDLLSNIGNAGSAGPVAAATAAPVAAAAEKKEEKKEEAADVDMGGLFGDDDGY